MLATTSKLVYAANVARRVRNPTAVEFGVVLARDPDEARRRLRDVLREAHHVRAEAARQLQVSPTLLRGWLARLGLNDELPAATRRVAARAAASPPWVYFIQAGLSGPVKIGWSANVAQRLADLQQAHYEELTLRASAPGGATTEAALHRVFRHALVRGEWFHPVRDLVELIEALDETMTLRSFLEVHDEHE